MEQLSEITGYDLFTIGRWERGEMTPSLLRFVYLCAALGLDVKIVPKSPVDRGA